MARFDPRVLFPEDEFVCERNVVVFDEHDAAEGKPGLNVDAELLRKLAAQANKEFAEVGVAVPLTLGHTLDAPAKEEDQPKIVGWAVNFHVEDLFDTGRKALYADFYIKKKYENVIEEYPGRSVELWRNRLQLHPIALLRSTPERPLPIIKYAAGTTETPYRYYFQLPTKESVTMPDDKDAAVKDAQEGEKSSVKELTAKVDALTSQFQQLLSVFQQLMEEEQGDDDKDGDEDDDDKDGDDKKGSDDNEDTNDLLAPADKPEKKTATPTNSYVPSFTSEDKVKMSRENDEAVKFARAVEEAANKRVDAAVAKALAPVKAAATEHAKKFARMRAEKQLAELESVEKIIFQSAEIRNKELELLTELDDESFPIHVTRMKECYQRKLPASDAVLDVAKYGRTQTPEFKVETIEDAQKLAVEYQEAKNAGTKSYEEFLKKKSGKTA